MMSTQMKKPKETSVVRFETELDDAYNKSVKISISRDTERRRLVTVYKHSNISQNRWEGAVINWSAIGSQDVEITAWFILALQAAVKWARWFDRNYPVGTLARVG